MGVKILVVDDEVEICRSLRRLLRRFGFEVSFSVSPNEALQMVAAEHFEAVISDYRMPELNGTELLAQISRISPGTVRLMLSACAEIDTLARTYDEGHIARFVRKPWNDADLAGNLLALLAERGAVPVAQHSQSWSSAEAAQSRVW
jgi:c-di-GMP phosphodiesterase